MAGRSADFEVDLDDVAEVGEGLLDRLTLADGLDLQAAGDIPVAIAGDHGGEMQRRDWFAHGGSVPRISGWRNWSGAAGRFLTHARRRRAI